MLHQLFSFKLSKTLASPELSLLTASCAGKYIVLAFSEVSLEALKGKNQIDASTEKYFSVGKVYLTVSGDGVTPDQWWQKSTPIRGQVYL